MNMCDEEKKNILRKDITLNKTLLESLAAFRQYYDNLVVSNTMRLLHLERNSKLWIALEILNEHMRLMVREIQQCECLQEVYYHFVEKYAHVIDSPKKRLIDGQEKEAINKKLHGFLITERKLLINVQNKIKDDDKFMKDITERIELVEDEILNCEYASEVFEECQRIIGCYVKVI